MDHDTIPFARPNETGTVGHVQGKQKIINSEKSGWKGLGAILLLPFLFLEAELADIISREKYLISKSLQGRFHKFSLQKGISDFLSIAGSKK